MAVYALALLIALLIAGSLLPAETKVEFGTHGLWHRPLHVFLFALMGLLARLSFRRVPVWVLAASIIGFGFTLELAEHFYYTVSLEWWDVADDALGAVIGLGISLLVRTRSEVK